MARQLYWLFSHLGLVSFPATFLLGFRHAPEAPLANLLFDLLLYALFIVVHIVMTMPAFKQRVYGRPEGTPLERRIYVTISIVTWVGLYALHRPIDLFGFEAPAWLQFLGICGVLLAVVAFFEFATFEGLARLVAMPGSELSHTVGSETPLMKEGPYARVRHPMYRAAFLVGFASLLIHPHAGQLVFALLTAGSFVGFIPFEEHQLVQARGEEYRSYMRTTPYRLFYGLW
jgi:protein-S-isoprenylcysteine O-methyltransferase Ste14